MKRPERGQGEAPIYSVHLKREVVAFMERLPNRPRRALHEQLKTLRYHPPPAGEAEALDEPEMFWKWLTGTNERFLVVFHKDIPAQRITVLFVSYAKTAI